jgi:hypothetical protein
MVMTWKRFLISAPLAALVILSACNLPGVRGGGDPAAATAAQETRVADVVGKTLTAAASEAPPATPTASQTPPPPPTLTSDAVTVSVSYDTNCRTGPGQAYPMVGGLFPGQTTRVLARSSAGDYWVVQNLNAPPAICWLWGYYATVTGDWQSLPVATPPPTPTPAPNFTVTYVEVVTCGGNYAFSFQIQNTGALTLESLRIMATDNTAVASTTHTRNFFRSYDSCAVDSDQDSLGPGASAVVTNADPGEIAYDPAGHSFTAVFTLCTLEDLAGTCLNKTVNFTP